MSEQEATCAVRLESASLVSDKHRLLHNVELELWPRESYALLGANGAGKSSLLRTIKGLTKLSSGTISWAPEYVPQSQALAGQEANLLPRSAWDNLKFVASGDHDALNRAISICEHLELLDIIHEPVASLSAGKQQQVNIVRALMFNPTLLLLDEPFAALDGKATALLIELLNDYRQDNLLVFSTHSAASARKLARQIIFIHQGEVLELTPKNKFFKLPRSGAARAFMRSFRQLEQ